MNTKRQYWLLLGLLLLTVINHSQANQLPRLNLASGLNKPPYVIQQGETGYELDMIKTIFTMMDYPLNITFTPLTRSYNMLKNDKTDIVLTISNTYDFGANAYFSQPYVSYANVAISQKKRQLTINKISELGQYSIVGFLQAKHLLGDDYSQAAKDSPLYLELAEQTQQLDMLMAERTDIVIMEINIFKYWATKQFGEQAMDQFDIHWLFPTNQYSLAFKDPKIRNQFDKALADYQQSPAFIQLKQKYLMSN